LVVLSFSFNGLSDLAVFSIAGAFINCRQDVRPFSRILMWRFIHFLQNQSILFVVCANWFLCWIFCQFVRPARLCHDGAGEIVNLSAA
jgi:hypothetical protein